MGTSQSCYKKGHMTNIHLTVSDEEAIVDFVKDHDELYYKTNKHFKDKARKECHWERFANSRKLSVKVCNTWFKSQRTCYSKLNRDQHAVNRHHITASTSYQPHHSFRTLFITQMRTILSSFFRQKQETTCTAFCNYLESKVEGLAEKDFQTFYKQSCKAS